MALTSPEKQKFTGIIKRSLNRRIENKTNSELVQTKEETLKTVEDRIIQKFISSPAENQQSLKRFQQLQEYINMAYREIKINKNTKNEARRIVKGEIPLGTDTQINHNVRESYPRIREIKRRLKNCLSIKCDFDEVIKYAKEYYGFNNDDDVISNFKIEDKIKSQPQYPIDDQSVKIIKTYPNLILTNNEKVIHEDAKEDKKELENLNASFTKQKWSNIDELIQALQHELKETKHS